MISHYKNELDEVGCCKIPNFIKQESLDKMFKEVIADENISIGQMKVIIHILVSKMINMKKIIQ